MTVVLVFMAGLAVVAGWWLSRQKLSATPWLASGVEEFAQVAMPPPAPAAKVGLGVFMAVAASLLVLMISAYFMRMDMPDWVPPPRPALLWVNTGVLVVASLAMHHASVAAGQGDREGVKAGLVGGTVATVAFLVGQVLAWRELAAAGYVPASNPADAFFYLITAAHGLHVIGGLVALARTSAKLRRGVAMDRLRLSVELSATYAHFLLFAWLVLFSVLSFAPQIDWLVAICTAPFR